MEGNFSLKEFFNTLDRIMQINRQRLVDLDSVAGDGDLGLTMSDGFSAINRAVSKSNEKDAGKLLYLAGKAMALAAPSSMGTLIAAGLLESAKRMRGTERFGTQDIYNFMDAWLLGMTDLGKARRGEKTFIDGWAPAMDIVKDCRDGTGCSEILIQAAEEAERGARSTVGMIAVHGRAAIRGEESRKILDPGAVVASLIVRAMAESVKSSGDEKCW